jgi:NhaB family Na+:H+ antiporter
LAIRAYYDNFLGRAPGWYKATIVAFLVADPLLLLVAGPTVAGWAVVLQLIYTLAMATKCYPLQPGGLIAIEAVLLGLSTPGAVAAEIAANFNVLLLLIFMIAGIYFLKDLLLFVFTRLLTGVWSKVMLSLAFCAVSAVLSAFLDALTVMAVVITVAAGFMTTLEATAGRAPLAPADREGFEAFLRDVLMHAAVGTALGGACTLVGEPQNLLIGQIVGWDFVDYAVAMAPVSVPVLAAGLATCWAVERWRIAGFGAELPAAARAALEALAAAERDALDTRAKARLGAQLAVVVLLVMALALHVAEVGLIGLAVIIVATALTGVVEEHRLGEAFEEAMPFAALIVVFFAVVSVIHEQHLFAPVIGWALGFDGPVRNVVFYLASGALSVVSDNVFVATVYIRDAQAAFEAGTIDRAALEQLAIAINMGTNVPSIATPNGQAAFLFLLTSGVALALRLTYLRMVVAALPYTLTMASTGFVAIWLWV